MEGFSLLGLNLPMYIVITLLLGYFVWSKFLKKDRLKPENVNDILDIFSIFILLIVTLLSITVFSMIISGLFSLNLNLQKIVTDVPRIVSFLSLLGIWAFIGIFRNEEVSKRDLKKIFIGLIKFFLFLIAYFIGQYVLILVTVLRYALWDMVFILPFILFLVFFCYITVNNVLFDLSFKRDILDKFVFKLVPAIIIIVFILGLLAIPIIKYNKPIYEAYYISNPDSSWGEAYLHTKVTIDVKTFGVLGSIIPIIPIRYEPYHFETEGFGGKNFKIKLNLSDKVWPKEFISSFERVKTFKDKSAQNFGFTNLILYEDKGLINLKFDEKNIKNSKIKQIFLEGYIKKNMSELDYSYSDNSRDSDSCNSDGCIFIFNITNKLKLPIHQDKDILVNFNNNDIKNISNCKFINVTSNFQKEGEIRMLEPSCSGNSCALEIRDIVLRKDIFSMRLYLDGDVVKLHYIKIEKPIEVNAKFILDCSQ